ncbi:hypothetical protein LCGC14_1717670 [marine sediment metagenome]|uniref:Uncharacterized protein n=1 Tax=marine sediment metagenome TaxID=412755 RepID=A0A0F9HD39_9ZZZZ
MKIYYNNIPATHLSQSPRVPSDAIMTNVTIYEEALDYIKCDLTNTIRHETAHRQDEEERRESDFSAFTETSRAEAIAEATEQDCGQFYPQQLSNPIEVNVSEIFEESKVNSGVGQGYLVDVKAVILDDAKLGLYYMQELPGMYDFQDGEMRHSPGSGFDLIQGWDGSLYINVARHFKDWIVKEDTMSYKPNVQTDGVEVDPDLIRQTPVMQGVPSSQSVPSVPSRESR